MWKCWCLGLESANRHTGRSVAAGLSVAAEIATKCIVSAEWSTKEWNRYSGGNHVSVQLDCIYVALLSDVDVRLCPCFCVNQSWAALQQPTGDAGTFAKGLLLRRCGIIDKSNMELCRADQGASSSKWLPASQNQHTAQELRHRLPSLNNTQQMNPKITHHTPQPPV